MEARDREHFDAVARAFAEDARRRQVEADARDVLDRMRQGYALGQVATRRVETAAELDRRALAQAELHARWRALQAKRG